MKKLLQHTCTDLSDGKDLVLVTISSQSGSTPRLMGAKMIIQRDGCITGTIGGGVVEAMALREAKTCFADGLSRRRTFDLANGDAAATDMICGGMLELYVEYIAANEANRVIFQALLSAMQSGRRATLVCPLAGGSSDNQRFVVDHQGTTSREDIPKALLLAIKQVQSSNSFAMVIEHQGQAYLLSCFAVAGTVYLLGAGHVAVCTAEAAARVGFRIAVIDDRIEFANRERFPWADEINVLPTFTDCFHGINIDTDAYLVIVTRGHIYDMDVLDQALRTDAGYIGMIGSRKKRNAIYAKLIDRGVTEVQLERVHCPIGVAIEADTPEEIAISIVGELIYQRAKDRKAWHIA